MPLLDHFHPPLKVFYPWTSFHSSWASKIADQLNAGVLPADYYALPNCSWGSQLEIDVATSKSGNGVPQTGPTAPPAPWTPPRPALTATIDMARLDRFEIQVLQNQGGPQLRAAIELISPANRDRPSSRLEFAGKCAGYLRHGVAVVVVDIVTERLANLHTHIVDLLEVVEEPPWQSPTHLYAVAYRTRPAGGTHQVEIWPEVLTLGAPLPIMPLYLEPGLCLPLPLEDSYVATCQGLRIRL